MRKLDDIIIDAYNTCFVEGRSREFIAEECTLEIGTLSELKSTINPGITGSMTLTGWRGPVVCIVKEDILFAPEEYRFMLFKFIIYHEMGHIVNNDKFEDYDTVEEAMDKQTIQEMKADLYAVEKTGITVDEYAALITYTLEAFKERAKTMNCKVDINEAFKVIDMVRDQRIEYVKKNKGCA